MRAARWWKRALATDAVACAEPADDDLTTALIPVALDLVTAVHNDDRAAIDAISAVATLCAGDRLAGAWALAILCAGMCLEDEPTDATLGWTLNRDRYRQLVDDGVGALTASLRAGRTDALPASTKQRGA